ncbi:MAG: tetratricopeptide repeat protein [Bacteroidetes bacterium]|nr:tetratricopeptide repeat protein [Bacteroidota bacterium]
MSRMEFDNHPSINELIFEYEVMSQSGKVSFLEETDFLLIADYFEKEYLIERALEALDNGLQFHVFSLDLNLRKAQLFIDHKKERHALRILTQMEKMAPYDIKVKLLQAEALAGMKMYSEALNLLEDLKDVSDREELSDIYVSESLVYDYLRQYENMFYALKEALTENPYNQIALERLWLCVEASRKYEESVELHETVLDKDSFSFMAWFNLGNAYEYLSHYEKAVEAYEFAYLINGNFEFAYRARAELLFNLTNYKEALKCYQEVIDRFPVDSDLFLRIGQCYQKLECPGIARTFFARAGRMDPLNDEILFHIGECFASEERWDSAIQFYNKAISIEGRREEYFAALAEAYYQIKNLEDARDMFQKACDIAPEFSIYWIQYSSFLMEIEEGELALNVLDEANNYTIGTELMYCRAACLFSLSRRDEALFQLTEALIENYKMHNALFDLKPELEKDNEVLAVISAHSE